MSNNEVNPEKLFEIQKDMQSSFLDLFSGIEVRPDPTLSANRWYCSVSPEIYEQLKKTSTERSMK